MKSLFFSFRLGLFCLFMQFSFPLFAQSNVGILFYNCQNFFDLTNDSINFDDDFQINGSMKWSYKRFEQKMLSISKVIYSSLGWEAPTFIGLCEIENDKVLKALFNIGGLKKEDYDFVTYPSPDPRGIDVALIYKKSAFKIISSKPIPVSDAENSFKTRDILMVNGTVNGKEVHLFVNHWPSRRGGELGSEPRRILAAEILKRNCDSIFALQPEANIIIMGDFNDTASDRSLAETLQALKPRNDSISDKQLYNLSLTVDTQIGSHKFGAEWSVLDQIIVSSNLMKYVPLNKKGEKSQVIIDQSFLLMNDDTNLGVRPFPTYLGLKYLGGYSDHLPVGCFLTF